MLKIVSDPSRLLSVTIRILFECGSQDSCAKLITGLAALSGRTYKKWGLMICQIRGQDFWNGVLRSELILAGMGCYKKRLPYVLGPFCTWSRPFLVLCHIDMETRELLPGPLGCDTKVFIFQNCLRKFLFLSSTNPWTFHYTNTKQTNTDAI